jgi:hypothetical protein
VAGREKILEPPVAVFHFGLSETESTSRLLHKALEKFGVPDHAIPRTIRHLLFFRPVFKTVRDVFDKDMAARLLRLADGRPDSEEKWSALTYDERQRAKRAWNALGRNRTEHRRAKRSPTSIGPSRGGRPTAIDPALVLYCVRVLCEARGKADFPLGRGPMWRALIDIFPLMQSYVAVRSNMASITPAAIGNHVEAIASDVKLAKSKDFRDWCVRLGLGAGPEGVAYNADTFRFAFAVTRKARREGKRG